MPHMYDLDRVGIGQFVKNLVAIAAEHFDAKSRIGRWSGAQRLSPNLLDGIVDRTKNISSACGTAQLKVSENFFEISQRPRAIASPHTSP